MPALEGVPSVCVRTRATHHFVFVYSFVREESNADRENT